MPNWCSNYVEIRCPNKDIYDKLLESISQNKLFQTFAPLNLDPEIYKNDYDHNKAIAIWGTKWEANDVEIISENETDLTVELFFDSAWAPPFGVYKSMKNNFNMEIISMFNEPGCCFFGNCEYNKYVQLEAIYNFPYNEEELQELEKKIGNKLNEYMSPTWTQLMEEWASEDSEDCEETNEDDNKESEMNDIVFTTI
jgi:hypothetical protein